MRSVAPATANAASEAGDIRRPLWMRKRVAPRCSRRDWDCCSGQVRQRRKYDLDDAQVRPYFELNRVLQDGVFYAANQLYGITFSERKDLPLPDGAFEGDGG